MTIKLKRRLIRLFLLFTMTVFTILLLFFAGNAVKKRREADCSFAGRLADSLANELLFGKMPTARDLKAYAEELHTWVFLSDGQRTLEGPECFPTPLSDLTGQIRSGIGITGIEETVSSRQEGASSRRTTHRLTGRESETYYGIQMSLYGPEGSCALILIYPLSGVRDILLKDCRLYPLLWLLALASMHAMSRFLIGRALLPVEASVKSQKEFIAAASHELKAPLAVIQANAEALEPADETPKCRRQAVILEECGRMAKLLDSLLTLAATDAGSFQIQPEETDMDTLLIETWEAFRPLCRKKEVALVLNTGEECCPKVVCDKGRIRQVLQILLDNALDHSPASSSISLTAAVQKSRTGDSFVCAVADHGPGIPDNAKGRVFERFYCGDASRTDRNHFGLGLSIAKEIMERHQGAITLTDTPGGGCTFRIHLPLTRF